MNSKMKIILMGMMLTAVISITNSSIVYSDNNQLVIETLLTFSEGGGYDNAWMGHGTPENIVFKEKTILSKSVIGTYCSGFTFAIVMRVLNREEWCHVLNSE